MGDLNKIVDRFASQKSSTPSETMEFLKHWGGGLGSSLSSSKLYLNDKRMSWLNLDKTPLPHAPNLKMYCFYGVGVSTERAYYYKHYEAGDNNNNNNNVNNNNNIHDEERYNNYGQQQQHYVDLPVVLDTSYNDPKKDIKHGIRFSDGDGSVPLVSLGYLCVDAWKRNRKESKLNPSNIDVITREYIHRPQFTADDPMRGGPTSSDHVDILGNVDMTEDLLRIVSDFHPVKENHIYSNIESISTQINHHKKKRENKNHHIKSILLSKLRRYVQFSL